jgi:hypothetical protein
VTSSLTDLVFSLFFIASHRSLKAKIKRINESVVDPNMKFNELVNLFRSPASGLARFEANRLINRLLSVNPPATLPSAGDSGEDLHSSAASTTAASSAAPSERTSAPRTPTTTTTTVSTPTSPSL